MKHMSSFFIVLIVILFSCTKGDDIDSFNVLFDTICVKRDTVISGEKVTVGIDKIVKYMAQNSTSQTQGASCHDKYLFDVGNNMTYVHLYDLDAKRLVKRFSTNINNSLFHCNNVSFSNIYYSSNDLFPLLFISQQRTNPPLVHVCRITGDMNNPKISIVNVIVLPNDKDIYIKNCADVVLDNENSTMYAYTVSNENKLCTYKFNIPQVLGTDTINLTKEEIIETYLYDNSYPAKQGAVINNGLLYIIKGIPNRYPLGLTIINLYDHSWSEYDLSKYGVNWEPEGLFFYNEELYCTSNFNRGIYKICMNKN